MSRHYEDGTIIETIQVGNSMKVTAIDPVTMREASVIVPAHTSRSEMINLAVKKLQYVQQKDQH